MFMFRSAAYLAELDNLAPEILTSCRQAVEGISRREDCLELGRAAFLACPSESIDYAVMEKTAKAVVMPLDAGWSDVGSWASLYDIREHDGDENVQIGNTLTMDCRHCYIRSEGRLVVGVGLDGVVVVDTADAVLVMPKDKAQSVKEVVSQLEEGRSDITPSAGSNSPRHSRRILDSERGFTVLRVDLEPGSKMDCNPQDSHAEHFVVVSGTARLGIDGESLLLGEGKGTIIPSSMPYTLESCGTVPLKTVSILISADPQAALIPKV